MKDLNFPVDFVFHISTLSNDFTATDANGKTLAYVRQKMFKFKEAINVFSDDSKTNILYNINADRWIDFSAAYTFTDADGKILGRVARKGWRSLWKAEYNVFATGETPLFNIREENGWIKVMDALLGEIPILSLLTGYLFNPAYIVKDQTDKPIVRIKKQPSFFGRKFQITRIDKGGEEHEANILLSLMMMILLERRRG